MKNLAFVVFSVIAVVGSLLTAPGTTKADPINVSEILFGWGLSSGTLTDPTSTGVSGCPRLVTARERRPAGRSGTLYEATWNGGNGNCGTSSWTYARTCSTGSPEQQESKELP